MAGIIWAKFAFIPATFCWILIIILATRLVIGLRRPNGVFGKYLILPLFFLIGGVHTPPFLFPPENPQHIYHQIGPPREVVLTGILIKSPEKRGDKTKIFIEMEQLHLEQKNFPSHGKVLITMHGSPPNTIRPGDTIIAKARLSRPRNFGVPGAFDYASYLANQKIWVTGWLSTPYLLRKVTQIPPPTLATQIRFLPERVRQKIGLFIDNSLPESTAGIYKALIIGDRSNIPPSITESYKTAGNIHLLAISGLHIGLLAFFLSITIVWVLKHFEAVLLKWSVWQTTALLSSVPLAIYALLAGFHTPVFRAIIMTYIFMGAVIFNRQDSLFNNLALAALILLSLNPTDLFSVSFQLSFAAVGSIALIFPQISALFSASHNKEQGGIQREHTWPSKLKAFCLASIFISCAASLGTAPLLAYHFNRVSLLSPISTLLAEPLLCFWSLPFGLLSCLLIPLPTLATKLLQIGEIGIQASNYTSEVLADLPFSSAWLTTPSLSRIIFYYAVLFFGIFFLTNQKRTKLFSEGSKIFQTAFIFLFLILLMLVSFWWEPANKKSDPQSIISILDVGQGLSIVIELPDNKTFIIDGGKQQAGPSNRFNVGRDVIAPFLWKKQIDKITAIAISHQDSDHTNGIPFLVEHFHPDTIWTNSKTVNSKEVEQIRRRTETLEIPIIVPTEDEELYAAEGISLKAIGSQHRNDLLPHKSNTGNNTSLILKLAIGNIVCLFPGDIEEETEQQLITKGVDLKADILIAPHHGSKTSSSDAFIKNVSADYVVISSGQNKRGIFPSDERVQKYRETGSTILTTAKSGSVFFSITDTIETATFY